MDFKNLKKLVVFYSFSGNTKFIAESICDITGADLLELKPKSEESPNLLKKFVWVGRQVMMREKPELLTIDKNPEDYDILFIGAPIWANKYAPAINSFLDKMPITDKKIALFYCHARSDNKKALSLLKQKLIGNDFIGEIEFKDPLQNNKEEARKQTKQWINTIIKPSC
ncbi:flavodoxin family protein [Vallitalea okinawensis]|uniref:flavodoxin family protein n=1 Tax=Vallitalea okinawensis TaxID=2078660 RepID=UPI0014780B4B|nr:flavodoxin [Vallitalea okinawensis]